jgi:hypothetical protein
VTPLILMIIFGTMAAGTKFQCAREKPIESKAIMPSCATTWLVWHVHRAVSRVVPLLWNALYVCLCIASIAANSTSNVSLLIPLMSWSSLTHYFSHSL